MERADEKWKAVSVHKLAIIYNRTTKQSKMRSRSFQHFEERFPAIFFYMAVWQCDIIRHRSFSCLYDAH